MKKIFKRLGCRVWAGVGAALIILLLVVTILANTVLYPVVISVFGGPRAKFASDSAALFETEYENKAQVLEAANKYNETICEEGFVLLKNKDNALPVYTPESVNNRASAKPKVSVFGKNSVNIAIGGSGSGGSSGEGAKTIYDSLNEAGYETNSALYDFYNGGKSGKARPASPEGSNLDDGKTLTVPTYETPLDDYPVNVWSSVKEYNDVALVVITRMGGEGFDLPRSMDGVSGARKADDHYLQLDKNETELINTVCNSGFKKVVLILNVGTSFELGFLENSTEQIYNTLKGYNINSDKIDAALWIGFPGESGIMALGRILNGNVNPSGRTTDTYAMDFKSDPSWQNFGENLKADGDRFTVNGEKQDYFFVSYEEGIYVGYRYYETRGYESANWYARNVVYPFGHGLSYTSFSWEIADAEGISGKTVAEGETYTVKVKVTNTGTVAGKDVVQLYGRAPYNLFETEKPYEVLLDFAKTPVLYPESEASADKPNSAVVELTFDPFYLASFDYNDANGNGIFGYELDGGDDYSLAICRNAHTDVHTVNFSVPAEGIAFANDNATHNPIKALYSGNDNADLNSDTLLDDVLLRADWDNTFPKAPENYDVSADFISALKDVTHNNPETVAYEGADKVESIETLRELLTDKNGNFGFADGANKWEPVVSYDDPRWTGIIEKCSVNDLLAMVNFGAFKSNAIDGIGKPLTNDTDGPAGFVNFMLTDGTYNNTCYYAAQIVVASSWNEDIAQGFGEMVGDEGIVGADGRGNGLPYSGWYAPGANIHRSPFGGRNFEYMSEDGVLTGKMAAAQIRGCQSKGVYCFMKHFAVNDQETHRSNNGISVWLTEQALREIYLRPFEIAVKEGGTRAIMTSFNRIGMRWAGGDYRLLTQILRTEWGFKGMTVTDFTSGSYMDAQQMAYAGGDLNLNNQEKYGWNNFSADSAEDVAVLKARAKDILYTVVNSNAFNREIAGYKLPVWEIALIAADCVAVAGVALWGFFVVRGALKKNAD